MDRRLKKMARIIAVQERLHQLAELKVAALDREKTELESGEESLIQALNHDDGLQGLFIEAMARRLAVLARDRERVGRALETETGRMFAEALRLKQMERMSEKVRQDYLRELWKRGFEDLLDTLPVGD